MKSGKKKAPPRKIRTRRKLARGTTRIEGQRPTLKAANGGVPYPATETFTGSAPKRKPPPPAQPLSAKGGLSLVLFTG